MPGRSFIHQNYIEIVWEVEGGKRVVLVREK